MNDLQLLTKKEAEVFKDTLTTTYSDHLEIQQHLLDLYMRNNTNELLQKIISICINLGIEVPTTLQQLLKEKNPLAIKNTLQIFILTTMGA